MKLDTEMENIDHGTRGGKVSVSWIWDLEMLRLRSLECLG